MNELQIKRTIHEDVAQPPPSLIVDIDAAIAEGGRRIRRRAVVVRSAATVLALALPAAVVGLSQLRGAQPDAPVSPAAPSAAASAAPAPVPAPTRFDPLRLRLHAGWVPEGLPDRTQETGVRSHSLGFSKPPPSGTGFSRPALSGSIYVAGVTPTELRPAPNGPGKRPSKLVPVSGPSVGGQSGHWYGASTLAWHWAPNAWAIVTVKGYGSQQADREAATRFATNLRTDGDEAVRMPLSIAAPPQPLRLVRTLVSWTKYGVEGQLIFSDRDDEADPTTRIPRMLVVGAKPAGSGHAANTKVGGRPAYVSFDSDAGVVALTNVGGVRETVDVYDPVTMSYVGKARAQELVLGIQAIADPHRWTTTPVR